MADEHCSSKFEEAMDFEFYKALFDPSRSEIMKYLAIYGAKNITEISENFIQDRSVISRHLDIMHRYKIVNKKKEGRTIIYELNSKYVIEKFEFTTSKLKELVNK